MSLGRALMSSRNSLKGMLKNNHNHNHNQNGTRQANAEVARINYTTLARLQYEFVIVALSP